MRRFSAILLLLLFGLSLLSPLFGSDDESSLPACCRRGGNHHCSMMASSDSASSGPAFRSNGRCPFYPGFGSGTMQTFAGITPSTNSTFALAAKAASCNSFQLRVLSSLRLRAHSKRGPPLSV